MTGRVGGVLVRLVPQALSFPVCHNIQQHLRQNIAVPQSNFCGHSSWSLSPAPPSGAHGFAFEYFTCWPVWQAPSELKLKGTRYHIFFLLLIKIPLWIMNINKQAGFCCHAAKPRPRKTPQKGVNIYNFVSKRMMPDVLGNSICTCGTTKFGGVLRKDDSKKGLTLYSALSKVVPKLILKSWNAKNGYIWHMSYGTQVLLCVAWFKFLKRIIWKSSEH